MLDNVIILLAITSALIFLLLSISRIFTVYLGIVLGFFIFLSLNLEIKLLHMLDISTLTKSQSFMLKNEKSLLGFSIVMIPFLSIILSFFTCVCKKSKIFSILFGFFLPFIFMSFLVYINENIFIKLDFLKDLSNFFLDSKFYDFFYFHPNFIFYILGFLLFIKFFYYILLIIYHFIIRFSRNLKIWLINKNEEKNSR